MIGATLPATFDSAAFRELEPLRVWVNWQREKQHPNANSTTKIPYNPITGRRAKSNDSNTHFSYREAAAAQATGRYAGIGLITSLPYAYVDFDNCRDEVTGQIVAPVQKWIERFDSYTEISQSLRGVKIIIRTKHFPTDTGKNFRPSPDRPDSPATKFITWPGGGIELYGVKPRLFCFTGNHLEGTPDRINDATNALTALYQSLRQPRKHTKIDPNRAADSADDAERFKRCSAYVAKMPLAVSGQGGHDATLAVACECQRFGLTDADAMSVLSQYNSRLSEQWREDELQHKLDSSKELVTGSDREIRLREDRPGRANGRMNGNAHVRSNAHPAAVRELAEDDRSEPLNQVEQVIGRAPTYPNDPEPSSNGSAVRPADYVLVPGTFTTDTGEEIERGADAFTDETIDRIPNGTIYRRGGVAGQIVGDAGERQFSELSADGTRIAIDGHMRLGKWRSARGRGECPSGSHLSSVLARSRRADHG